MGGFGDLFGGLADLLGGVAEGVRAIEEVGGRDGEGPRAFDPNDAVDRYLVGGEKQLNVNDI